MTLPRPGTMIAAGAALLLAGCSILGVQVFDDVSGGDVYTGPDSAAIVVTTEQVGCCYMEGSLRFAKLEGPTALDWDVDDGSGDDAFDPKNPFLVGEQVHSVRPGEYTLTEWEEVCDGNCGYLDGPTNHCRLDFTAEPGQTVRIRVTFTIPNPCSATVETS